MMFTILSVDQLEMWSCVTMAVIHLNVKTKTDYSGNLWESILRKQVALVNLLNIIASVIFYPFYNKVKIDF